MRCFRMALIFALLELGWVQGAQAYPWFVRDGYNHCMQCHADPSGAGLLTEHGRATGEMDLRTRYAGEPAEPTALADFLWGYGPSLPERVLLGGSFRNGFMRQ